MKVITILYGLYCIIIAFFYANAKEPLIYNMIFVEIDLNYFLRDLAYIFGIALAACTSFVEDKTLRKDLSIVWLVYSFFHLLWALLLDSEFSLITNTITSILFIFSIIFVYEQSRIRRNQYKRNKGSI